MNIHIALVGPKAMIITGIRQYPAVDKIYLLYSKISKHIVEETKQGLQDFQFQLKDVSSKEVKPFSFDSVFDTVTEIGLKESQNEESQFFINITGGTKIMSVAATLAGGYFNAQPYYIMTRENLAENGSIAEIKLELPTKNIFYPDPLKSTRFKILQLVAEKKGREGKKGENISQKTIIDEIGETCQVISYNIKQLKRIGLISVSVDEEDSRKKFVSIRNPGRIAISFSKNNFDYKK